MDKWIEVFLNGDGEGYNVSIRWLNEEGFVEVQCRAYTGNYDLAIEIAGELAERTGYEVILPKKQEESK